MDEKNQLIIYEKAKAFIPSLMRASRMNNTELAKKEELLLKVFRMIDTKKSEFEMFVQSKSLTVVKPEKIKNEKGDVVALGKVIHSHNIAFLIKKNGRDEIVLIIRMLLFNVNEYFVRKERLTAMQIKEIAEQIIDECGYVMSIDELIYIFKKAKIKAKVYNNGLDGNMIFQWIDEYYTNLEEQRHKNHLDKKFSDHTPMYSDELVKKFAIVPDEKEKAYLDRDNKAAGISVSDMNLKRSKFKPKK